MNNQPSRKKIYFACSIRGGREEAGVYEQIISMVNKNATVLSEIFADQKLTQEGMNKPNNEIWELDTEWIKESDALIVEVTQPSLGVGYEIALAESLSKPILCLYKKSDKKLSAMIDGSPNVEVLHYDTLDEVELAIENFIKGIE